MPRFAAVQTNPHLLDPDANRERILASFAELSRRDVQVAVFPECALSGYGLTPEEAEQFSESIPGPTTARLIQACADHRMYAALGLLEKDSLGHIYNTSVLIGPEGLLGKYRKTHLPFLGVDRFLAAGGVIPAPFSTPYGEVGMLICYDLRFPEPLRVLALKGAHVVLISTAWPREARLYPDFLARTRAAENGLFIVAANRVGEERGTVYLGHSLIAGPDGQILAEAGGEAEEMLLVDIDLSQSERKKRVFVPGEYELDLFEDRRPELYHPICTRNDDG
jgi:predicted amidohydrolase